MLKVILFVMITCILAGTCNCNHENGNLITTTLLCASDYCLAINYIIAGKFDAVGRSRFRA
jgi:hypothetical protein